jgi:Domain of unknown function (DUF4265)
MTNGTGHGLARVVFQLEQDAWHGSATERLWAEPIGSGRYRLRNTPFYAFGVSNEDIVFGDECDGQVIFRGVSIRGGHSSYRIKLSANASRDDFQRYWEPIEGLGSSYEEGPVIAVDVPPSTDVYAVYRFLETGSSAGVWDFEEGHCGHPLREGNDDTEENVT